VNADCHWGHDSEGLEGDLNRLVEKFQRANIISAQLILAMLYSDLLSATKMVENKL